MATGDGGKSERMTYLVFKREDIDISYTAAAK